MSFPWVLVSRGGSMRKDVALPQKVFFLNNFKRRKLWNIHQMKIDRMRTFKENKHLCENSHFWFFLGGAELNESRITRSEAVRVMERLGSEVQSDLFYSCIYHSEADSEAGKLLNLSPPQCLHLWSEDYENTLSGGLGEADTTYIKHQ